MKELTYLHCQCFNLANAANHFYSFAKSSRSRVPCVFVILEEYKSSAISMLQKFKRHDLNLYSVIITDIYDAESIKFFNEFAGDERQVF
jgi:hypothetical protein